MRRDEFLKLDTGLQLWAVLGVLKYMLAVLLPKRVTHEQVRLALGQFDRHVYQDTRPDADGPHNSSGRGPGTCVDGN